MKLIESLQKECYEVYKSRPDLVINGDFTELGKKLHATDLKIEQLKKLSIPLVVGSCDCGEEIPTEEHGIKFCYWCCKEMV